MLAITWPGHEGEPRQFLGVPGVYGPGDVRTLKELGLKAAEARALVEGTPLEVIEVENPASEAVDEPAPEAVEEG